MLTLFAALVPQILPPPDPPLPQRAYQPHLVDPGLDGGAYNYFLGNAELTPDGKVFVGFRGAAPAGWPGFRAALVAGVVDVGRMNVDAQGHLSGFYDPLPGAPFGEHFALSSRTESKVVHYGYEFVNCTPGTPGCLPCGRKPNPAFPLPAHYGNAHFTFALLPSAFGNPHPSNSVGVPDPNGGFLCYRLWIVRLHSDGYDGNLACQSTNEPFVPTVGVSGSNPVFVGHDVTLVINETSKLVTYSEVGAFEFLDSPELESNPGSTEDTWIHGIEPTITEDGRLLLFHGNGSQAPFVIGQSNVTYVYNPDPCSPTGWTKPRSITEMPAFTGTPAEQAEKLADFKRRYPLFAQSIRMPPSAQDADGHLFTSAETVRGTYPWVAKDGSFFLAQCATASEALEPTALETDPACTLEGSNRARAGGYVCGAITGGYVKYVDDVGINPTRRGGPWHWPPYESHPNWPNQCEYPNSWRSFLFSSGIKPGPWEPLLGEGAPVPTQLASARIPVLPVFENESDSYGEVRFEEADGNYVLYLACNESLRNDPSHSNPGERDVLFDVGSTPDTSGRAVRARCTLNAGAKFPQEIYGSEPLRRLVGNAELGVDKPLHENVGYKGQAIVFGAQGTVDARGAAGLAGARALTVQAFVKVLVVPGTALRLVEHGYDASGTLDAVVVLELKANGKLVARVDVLKGGNRVTLQATSRDLAVPFSQNLVNQVAGAPPGIGWRHVAITYDASDPALTRLQIHLDGQLDKTTLSAGDTQIWTPSGTPYYLVGPGRTSNPAALTDANKVLVLDEVAVSDVVRTRTELRRDAYVVVEPDGSGPWPSEVTLPAGLDVSEAKWPAATPYDAVLADLGRDLFVAPELSPVGRSCHSCHVPSEQFANFDEVRAESVVPGTLLAFNTPTLLNAAFGTHKTFDGRAASLEEQVLLPILSGPEMGAQTLVEALARTGPIFATASTPATEDNLTKSLAMYVRTLNSGAAPFDADDLTPSQRYGQALFFGKAMCFTCHRGTSFTDDDFHNVLTVKDAEGITGRGGFTGRVNELGQLKTPTLRNIGLTKRYFHDGSKASLLGVVEHYNDPPFDATDRVGEPDRHLRALGLTADEKAQLVAFLLSLNGSTPP